MGRIVGLTFEDGVSEEIRHPDPEKEGKKEETPKRSRKAPKGVSERGE